MNSHCARLGGLTEAPRARGDTAGQVLCGKGHTGDTRHAVMDPTNVHRSDSGPRRASLPGEESTVNQLQKGIPESDQFKKQNEAG